VLWRSVAGNGCLGKRVLGQTGALRDLRLREGPLRRCVARFFAAEVDQSPGVATLRALIGALGGWRCDISAEGRRAGGWGGSAGAEGPRRGGAGTRQSRGPRWGAESEEPPHPRHPAHGPTERSPAALQRPSHPRAESQHSGGSMRKPARALSPAALAVCVLTGWTGAGKHVDRPLVATFDRRPRPATATSASRCSRSSQRARSPWPGRRRRGGDPELQRLDYARRARPDGTRGHRRGGAAHRRAATPAAMRQVGMSTPATPAPGPAASACLGRGRIGREGALAAGGRARERLGTVASGQATPCAATSWSRPPPRRWRAPSRPLAVSRGGLVAAPSPAAAQAATSARAERGAARRAPAPATTARQLRRSDLRPRDADRRARAPLPPEPPLPHPLAAGEHDPGHRDRARAAARLARARTERA
jgi:hypothetical protein